jgi:hypothetical protein
MKRALTAAIVLVILIGAAHAEPIKAPRRPDLVTRGMTPQQVEELVGRSIETCWYYTLHGEESGVCFRNGKVSIYRDGQGFHGDMTQAEVQRLIKIDSVGEFYLVNQSLYRADYVNGRLAEFKYEEPPPLR